MGASRGYGPAAGGKRPGSWHKARRVGLTCQEVNALSMPFVVVMNLTPAASTERMVASTSRPTICFLEALSEDGALRTIHFSSLRQQRSFVTLNVPEQLEKP